LGEQPSINEEIKRGKLRSIFIRNIITKSIAEERGIK